jgi:hypothetical protein
MLRQLADGVNGFGYSGTIEVYYNAEHDNLKKLHDLLPELDGNDQGKIYAASVKLSAWGGKPPPGCVFLQVPLSHCPFCSVMPRRLLRLCVIGGDIRHQ